LGLIDMLSANQHGEIFSCILLGINKHLQISQRPQIALTLRACAILLVFALKNLLVLNFIPNCPRTHVITYTNFNGSECQLRSLFTVKI